MRPGHTFAVVVVRVITAVVIYFSRFFLFINNNRDFFKDHSNKLLKMTKLIFQECKTNEFKRSGFAIAIGLNVYMLNFRNLFFLSITIRTFIKTAIISYLKQLKLPINNKKLMNLRGPSLFSFPA